MACRKTNVKIAVVKKSVGTTAKWKYVREVSSERGRLRSFTNTHTHKRTQGGQPVEEGEMFGKYARRALLLTGTQN